MQLSVVIPTYNRGPKLRDTIQCVLDASTAEVESVEIVVVDDGSHLPARAILSGYDVAPPFSLRCIEQSNAGPAAARNHGFRDTGAETVLFLDDDILATPELLGQHIRAHRQNPGCIVFGSCPLLGNAGGPLYRYLEALPGAGVRASGDEMALLPSPIVASGNISVPRSLFSGRDGVYCADLGVPAAEEFELSYRLQRAGVPILYAPNIVAWHDQASDLSSICRQQYKHSLGAVEAAVKYPETLNLPELRTFIEANQRRSRPPRWASGTVALKEMAATRFGRTALYHTTRLLERCAPIQALLAPFYRATLGAYTRAGIRDGSGRFGSGMLCSDPLGRRSPQ